MPIYEYECLDCGADFEKLVRTPSAEEGIVCPECGSVRVEKLVSVCSPVGGAMPESGISPSLGGG